MKALELAEQLDVFVACDGGDFVHIENAASELRRLAEVNAELLEALEKAKSTIQYYASVCSEDDQPTPAKDSINRIDHAYVKAKEQQ